MKKVVALLVLLFVVSSCQEQPVGHHSLDAAYAVLGSDFPLEPPLDYSSTAPNYITKDNRLDGDVDDKKATLGRILFYDKALSLNNSISCGSCHIQSHGFGDTLTQSIGLDGGVTSRQSMRIVNTRFADVKRMFWDRRAMNMRDQVTQPIQDHIEMGFSGTAGQPTIDSLIERLSALNHYPALFDWAFEDGASITEDRIGEALEHFVSSIESFDSKFDDGFSAQGTLQPSFQNFTTLENEGKALFLAPPQLNIQNIRVGGGAGCAGCHRPPEFDIVPNSRNNGVDREAGNPAGFDTTNTRSPTLRDLFDPNGQVNTPMMHTGNFKQFTTVIEHYNEVIPDVNNTTVDTRLKRGQGTVKLELSTNEREALEAFVKTLTGANLYVDQKWSSPF
jgi:cytochrome c peroxidase